MPSTTTKIAVVGHVTNDRLSDGLVPGGSALYAALTLRALGAEVSLLTSHGPDFVGSLKGLGATVVPAEKTTTFENRYVGGVRRQRLLARAALLDAKAVDDAAGDAVIYCPVAGEVEAPRAGPVVAACLQGWMRRVDEKGAVSPAKIDPALFGPCHMLFLSEEDLGGDTELVPALIKVAQTVIVTEGAKGARIFFEGKAYRVHACPAKQVDPTGAGDVFAAAFTLAVVRRESLLAAAVVAACAAAIAVEGVGASGLAGLDKLGKRITSYRKQVPPPAAE